MAPPSTWLCDPSQVLETPTDYTKTPIPAWSRRIMSRRAEFVRMRWIAANMDRPSALWELLLRSRDPTFNVTLYPEVLGALLAWSTGGGDLGAPTEDGTTALKLAIVLRNLAIAPQNRNVLADLAEVAVLQCRLGSSPPASSASATRLAALQGLAAMVPAFPWPIPRKTGGAVAAKPREDEDAWFRATRPAFEALFVSALQFAARGAAAPIAIAVACETVAKLLRTPAGRQLVAAAPVELVAAAFDELLRTAATAAETGPWAMFAAEELAAHAMTHKLAKRVANQHTIDLLVVLCHRPQDPGAAFAEHAIALRAAHLLAGLSTFISIAGTLRPHRARLLAICRRCPEDLFEALAEVVAHS